ncbi:MAG TPA: hypothetical protein VKU36_01465 [Candidatus Babeliales bacterium]|nr:hypothetical protein [Candidatus Babeliales bacterium]
MDTITIFHIDELNLIFSDTLCLSGEQSEEIDHNMWCISLEGNLIESITVEQLKHFVDKLIENREQQLKDINSSKSAVFYMWFDQQALQLRFNVITGDIKSLPFSCKVQLNATVEPILNNFIETVKDVVQFGDQIEFFNSQNWDDEDDNEEEYILDVFAKKLKINLFKT